MQAIKTQTETIDTINQQIQQSIQQPLGLMERIMEGQGAAAGLTRYTSLFYTQFYLSMWKGQVMVLKQA